MSSSRWDLSISRGRPLTPWKQGTLSFTITLLVGIGIVAFNRDAWAQGAGTGEAPAAKQGAPQSPTCGPDWQVVSTPNQGPLDNYLYGATAISSSDVWAVGTYKNGTLGYDQTLVEHWDGSSWIQVASPNASTSSNTLSAVAAASSSSVWAVGNYFNPVTSHFRTLIEHWNGSAWNVVSSPNAGSGDNYLNGVSVEAANDVWAVGYYLSGSSNQTLVEHWNGSSWSIVPSADNGTDNNLLNSVTAVSVNDVWAVGTYRDSTTSTYQTLVERWDGSAWSIVPSPNQSGVNNGLASVSAVAADDVWAVGLYYAAGGGTPPVRALTEHWDGSSWSIVPNPSVSTGSYLLRTVEPVSANSVWAVGGYQDESNVYRTLVEHWNGSGWHVVPSPNVGAGDNGVIAMAVVSETDIWAFGSSTDTSGNSRTLAERYNPCASLTCGMQFQDVPSSNPFYLNIEAMACQTIVSGYPCGGLGQPCVPPTNYPYFLPNNNVTRGQIAKIVALSAGLSAPVSGQTFQDVPPGSTFYIYVEQLAALGVMGGYTCGGPGEPCVPPTNRPYFRPNSSATRGQLAKIDSNTVGFSDTPSGQIFQDVPPSDPFYSWIERLAERGIMGGYTCGGPGQPCVPPGNRPYFLPNNNVTRGQTSKIVANTFFP